MAHHSTPSLVRPCDAEVSGTSRKKEPPQSQPPLDRASRGSLPPTHPLAARPWPSAACFSGEERKAPQAFLWHKDTPLRLPATTTRYYTAPPAGSQLSSCRVPPAPSHRQRTCSFLTRFSKPASRQSPHSPDQPHHQRPARIPNHVARAEQHCRRQPLGRHSAHPPLPPPRLWRHRRQPQLRQPYGKCRTKKAPLRGVGNSQNPTRLEIEVETEAGFSLA